MIRHYSFDLWGTLIKSNSSFKTYRANYFWEKYGKEAKMSHLEVAGVISGVEKWGDAINMLNGRSISPLELIAMVVFRITGSLSGLTPLNMELIYMEIEIIFLAHPPTLYSQDTVPVLDELRKRGKTMSLLSNTGFIRGKTMDRVLAMYNMKDQFMFRIYSDEVNLSKPSKEIFKLVDDKLAYDAKEVMHIGDDPINDGQGAKEYGFKCMVINTNSLTIKDLL